MSGLHRFVAALTDQVGADLAASGHPVARLVSHPGPRPPADVCSRTRDGDGQAWVGVAGVWPTGESPFPSQNTSPTPCRRAELAVELRVGVLRCAARIADDGTPPAASLVGEDAALQAVDMLTLYQTIVCTLDAWDVDLMMVGRWVPLGPEGGCVGGEWPVTIPIPR